MNVCPVITRKNPTGSQMSHEPRTGIIDTIIARNVRIRAFGIPKKSRPTPSARPWTIPMKTCPKTIAFVIPLNSFRNFFSVASENGESVDIYFLSSSESLVAK